MEKKERKTTEKKEEKQLFIVGQRVRIKKPGSRSLSIGEVYSVSKRNNGTYVYNIKLANGDKVPLTKDNFTAV